MGTWGFSILADDTALDVHSDYMNLFNQGKNANEIVNELTQSWADELDDEDEGPIFWLAVARAQWDCGQLQPEVLAKVESIVDGNIGMDRWREMGPKTAEGRQRALDQFITRLHATNPKPKGPKQVKLMKPVFQPGDCLSVLMPNGLFAAVLVLRQPGTEDIANETGSNLVVALEYCKSEKPDMATFARREIAVREAQSLAFGRLRPVCSWVSMRFARSRAAYEKIGTIPLTGDEPKEAHSATTWESLPNVLTWDLCPQGN